MPATASRPKLRRYQPLLDACIARVLSSLKTHDPEMGCDVAIDASDLPAYAYGQRFVSQGGPAPQFGVKLDSLKSSHPERQ